MVGEVYEINSEGNVWLLDGGALRLLLRIQSACVPCGSCLTGKHSEKRETEDCGSSITQKREREERLIVLKERKEREETGRVEGTAHMLSHCF